MPSQKIKEIVSVKNNANNHFPPICRASHGPVSKCLTYCLYLFDPYNTACKVLVRKVNEAQPK